MEAALSHYRILEQIGQGGMGVVYRAHDEHLDCDVALKVLPAGKLADDAARKRFRKEALALSKLNHPNIAVVHDFDTQDGNDFLVEELIPGLSLNEMLLSAPLPEREIIHLGSQLAEGLEAAHHHGIMHCDLKPSNIRVTPDARLKILDFGLAKVLHSDATAGTDATASVTETQQVIGTLPYMAPEQLLNQKLDARTDIWAAGCVLYEMATGQRPFLGSGPALTDSILHQPPVPPSRLNRKLNPGLEAIVLKCLEKDPELRYASARDMAVDFRRLASGPPTIRVEQLRRRVPTRNIVLLSALVAVLILASIVVLRFIRRPSSGRVPQSAQVAPSLAVLPFVDMSPGKDQEYFSDGLAEELLNALTKIPELRVTARTSSFRLKNADLRTIGEKLNVATVLEGSVRKQGNRVRITAQLIKVSDGFHLWSETYDRDLTDIFAVQEEIARSVAGSLKVTLLGAKAASSQVTTSEAYTSYLHGRYFSRPFTKERLEEAVRYYQEAIGLDPGYAPAWAGLSQVRSTQAGLAYIPSREGFRKARQEAERALALNPNLAEAHAALGSIKRTHDWDWAGADASYRRALVLEPGNSGIVQDAVAMASTLGRWDDALRLAHRAVELDPLRPGTHQILGTVELYMGRLDEAAAALQKTLELNREQPFVHMGLGLVYLAKSRPQDALAEAGQDQHPIFRLQGLALAYHALGRKQESDQALAELMTKYRADGAFQIAEVYAFRGEADRAFEWLERAYVQRDGGLSQMKGDLLLKNIEHDSRYAALLKKLRLPLN
ncbi:MAG: protein kinase [Acidobacteriia bacterium]|nr:protein kinase [Terriglobia bacterium]